ncbi:MAG: hypothetical protein J6J23_05655, partial [Clostridia bacterium]|nr:hypothetical protein [Clostridia bacterium]
MNNNDNEIKFIKGRSNDSEVLVDLFKKGRYYDAFYGLKRLEKSEQIKFLPLVAEAYAKLNKSDYEANALLKLLMNSEGMKNENGLDKRVIALRLSDYYTYKGEKVQRLSFSYNDTQSNGKTTRQRNSQKTGDIIKFQIKESNGNEASTLQLLDEECNIYKKNNIRTDYGTYICSRATSLALAGKYNKAISVLQQIKKGEPSYLESRNILIAVLIDSSKVLQASEIAIELIKENPDEFIALFAINTALNLSINTDNILNALMEIEGKTGAQCSVLRANA